MAREGAAPFQESYGQGPKARDKNREKERSEVKLPAHRAGLAGHVPVRRKVTYNPK